MPPRLSAGRVSLRLDLLRIAGAAALSVSVFAACGGDDGDGDATPTPPNAPTATIATTSPTPAASATPRAPTPTPEPPSAGDAAAIDALVRASVTEYNVSNWPAVIALYSSCLKSTIPQGDELTAALQKGRAESGAGTVISVENIAVRGIYASAAVLVQQERRPPPAAPETYYFEREGGEWKLSTTFCQDLATPVF